MKINDKIYNYRKALGLSQEALAERLNISRQAVSKWETGEAMPDSDKLLPLARIFGVTVEHLLSDEEAITSTDSGERGNMIDTPAAEITAVSSSDPSFIKRMIKRHGYAFGAAVVLLGLLMSGLGCLLCGISGFTFIFIQRTDDVELRPVESATIDDPQDIDPVDSPSTSESDIAQEGGCEFGDQDYIYLGASEKPQIESQSTSYAAIAIFILGAVLVVGGIALIISGIVLLSITKKEKLRTELAA